jgi:cupin 2 domain-containing protein
MSVASGNLFADMPQPSANEQVIELLTAPNVVIERIAATGHASPPGFWYDQAWTEWVILLAGAAHLRFADEPALREMKPGDYIQIPPHARHRIEWTDPESATVWLAVHCR